SLKGKEGPSDLFEVAWAEGKPSQPLPSHTVVSGGAASLFPGFKLIQPAPGGAREWVVRARPVIIGRSGGDILFANDARMAPQHARLTADSGQLCVEDIGNRGVFVRLVAT